MKSSGLADSPLFKTKQINPTMPSRNQEINLPRNHATTIAKVYQAVTEVGREASTYRLSLAEKKDLLHITYSLRMHGMAISENEIVRIAINALIMEYQKEKKKSILGRILKMRVRKGGN